MLRRGDLAHWRDDPRSGVRRPTSDVFPATYAGRSVRRSAPIAFLRRAPGPPALPNHASLHHLTRKFRNWGFT